MSTARPYLGGVEAGHGDAAVLREYGGTAHGTDRPIPAQRVPSPPNQQPPLCRSKLLLLLLLLLLSELLLCSQRLEQAGGLTLVMKTKCLEVM